MSKPLPSEPQRKKPDSERRPVATPVDPGKGYATVEGSTSPPPSLHLWGAGDHARPEVGQPPAENEHVMANDHLELHKLRAENEELRQELDEIAAKSQQVLKEQEKEYEQMLEEKRELIRTLTLENQEAKKHAGAAAGVPQEKELLALSDELERERTELDKDRAQLVEERRQLQEDEQAMMQQMRQMEVQMAKERAELARQRTELQRLHSDIRHELELAERDHALNERLSMLQRKHQDVINRKGAEPTPEPPSSDSVPRPALPRKSTPPPKKDSGLFRRFFGKEE